MSRASPAGRHSIPMMKPEMKAPKSSTRGKTMGMKLKIMGMEQPRSNSTKPVRRVAFPRVRTLRGLESSWWRAMTEFLERTAPRR